VPVFACAGLHNPGLGGLADQPFAQNVDFEHQRFDVARQHHVAAAAQNEFGCGFQSRIGQQCINISAVLKADEC
jgi:hypothetical protein